MSHHHADRKTLQEAEDNYFPMTEFLVKFNGMKQTEILSLSCIKCIHSMCVILSSIERSTHYEADTWEPILWAAIWENKKVEESISLIHHPERSHQVRDLTIHTALMEAHMASVLKCECGSLISTFKSPRPYHFVCVCIWYCCMHHFEREPTIWIFLVLVAWVVLLHTVTPLWIWGMGLNTRSLINMINWGVSVSCNLIPANWDFSHVSRAECLP